MGGGEVQRITRSHIGVHADLKLAVVALQRGGAGAALNRRDIFEAHLPQLRRRHHHARQHFGIVALFREQLHCYGILLRAFLEARNFIFAGIEQPHRIAHVGHSNTDVRGPLPVHFYLQLRRIEIQAWIDIHQFRIFGHVVGSGFAYFRQTRKFRTANYRRDGKIDFAAKNGRQAHVIGHVAVAAFDFAHVGGQLHVTAFPLAPRYQHDKKVSMICGPVREGLDQRHFGKRKDAFRHFRRQLRGFLQRRTFRKSVGADQLVLIIRGDPIASHQMIKAKRGSKRKHADHEDSAAMGQRPAQGFQINCVHGMQKSHGVCFLFLDT